MSTIFQRMLLVCAVGVVTSSVYAVDGVVLIDQAHALAGNITPGDAPGFPVVISQSGSYRLSGNLTVPDADTIAIVIAAANVTIDLNGFSILGPNVCTGNPPDSTVQCALSGSGHGIETIGNGAKNIRIFNGTISGMGGLAILTKFPDVNTTVDHVNAVSNANGGIQIFGEVSDSYAALNHGTGIAANNVIHCVATRNSANGIEVLEGAALGNSSTHNAGSGVSGVKSVLTGNFVGSNQGGGVAAQCPGSTVIGNAGIDNAGAQQISFLASCASANNTQQ